MNKIFSRQQAIELSGLSSGQLSRLDKAGFVEPKKLGSSAHPTVLYTLNQVLELRTVAALRQKLSMQEIKTVIEHLRSHEFEPTLFDKFLIFCNDELYWIPFNELNEDIARLVNAHQSALTLKIASPLGRGVTTSMICAAIAPCLPRSGRESKGKDIASTEPIHNKTG